MNISSGIKTLEDLGLNIFLCQKVSELPLDVYPFTIEQRRKTLCMIGAGGPKLWEHLPRPLKGPHPIDQFTTQKVMEFGALYLDEDIELLYPHETIILPLQRLGRMMNFSHPSPMGIDISKDYGLWFGYRAVFLTNKAIQTTTHVLGSSPCDHCSEKSCLIDRLHCPIKKEEQYCREQISYYASQSALIRC